MDLISLMMVANQTPANVGQVVQVQLVAYADVPVRYFVSDIVFGWDPTKLRFIGVNHEGSHPSLWAAVSGVVPAEQDYTGCSEANPPADGDGMYYGYGVLGDYWYIQQPVQIVNFEFEVIDNFGSTEVSLVPAVQHAYLAETIVYGGNVAGSRVTGALTNATITGVRSADFNADGMVNGADMAMILQDWNATNFKDNPYDLNNNGVVDGGDLAILLDNWG